MLLRDIDLKGPSRRDGDHQVVGRPVTRIPFVGAVAVVAATTAVAGHQRAAEDLPQMAADPGSVRAQSYDLVVNGYEAGSGSIRIHDAAVQQQVFDLLGIDADEAERRFGFLLEALRYGAPPHGGIALGLDRWVMLFCGDDNIRDVIAFPKTQKATDLLSGAPSTVDDRQLRDLRIKVDVKK